MAYSKINWQNGEDAQTTPVNAENLNHMDNQIEANTTEIDDIERLGAFGISASGRTLTLKNKNGETIASATTQDTTYSVVTSSSDGLMSRTDKTRLDSMYTETRVKVIKELATSGSSISLDLSDVVSAMSSNYPITVIVEGHFNSTNAKYDFSATVGFSAKKRYSDNVYRFPVYSDNNVTLTGTYDYSTGMFSISQFTPSEYGTVKYLRVRFLNI